MHTCTHTLPAFGAHAGEAFVVLRLPALAPVLAGLGGARLQQGLAVLPWGGARERNTSASTYSAEQPPQQAIITTTDDSTSQLLR